MAPKGTEQQQRQQKQGRSRVTASSAREAFQQGGGSFGGSTQLEAIFAQFAHSGQGAAAVAAAPAAAAGTGVSYTSKREFVSDRSYAGNGASVASVLAAPASSLPPEVHLALTRVTKRDCLTRSKGLAELQQLLQETLDAAAVESLLPQLVFVYRSLALGDGESRNRAAASCCLLLAIKKVGRRIAPHLKQLLPLWLCALNDPSREAAAAAAAALQAAFPLTSETPNEAQETGPQSPQQQQQQSSAAKESQETPAAPLTEATRAAAADSSGSSINSKGLQRRLALLEHCRVFLLEELQQLLLLSESKPQQQQISATASSRRADESPQQRLDRHLICALLAVADVVRLLSLPLQQPEQQHPLAAWQESLAFLFYGDIRLSRFLGSAFRLPVRAAAAASLAGVLKAFDAARVPLPNPLLNSPGAGGLSAAEECFAAVVAALADAALCGAAVPQCAASLCGGAAVAVPVSGSGCLLRSLWFLLPSIVFEGFAFPQQQGPQPSQRKAKASPQRQLQNMLPKLLSLARHGGYCGTGAFYDELPPLLAALPPQWLLGTPEGLTFLSDLPKALLLPLEHQLLQPQPAPQKQRHQQQQNEQQQQQEQQEQQQQQQNGQVEHKQQQAKNGKGQQRQQWPQQQPLWSPPAAVLGCFYATTLFLIEKRIGPAAETAAEASGDAATAKSGGRGALLQLYCCEVPTYPIQLLLRAQQELSDVQRMKPEERTLAPAKAAAEGVLEALPQAVGWFAGEAASRDLPASLLKSLWRSITSAILFSQPQQQQQQGDQQQQNGQQRQQRQQDGQQEQQGGQQQQEEQREENSSKATEQQSVAADVLALTRHAQSTAIPLLLQLQQQQRDSLTEAAAAAAAGALTVRLLQEVKDHTARSLGVAPGPSGTEQQQQQQPGRPPQEPASRQSLEALDGLLRASEACLTQLRLPGAFDSSEAAAAAAAAAAADICIPEGSSFSAMQQLQVLLPLAAAMARGAFTSSEMHADTATLQRQRRLALQELCSRAISPLLRVATRAEAKTAAAATAGGASSGVWRAVAEALVLTTGTTQNSRDASAAAETSALPQEAAEEERLRLWCCRAFCLGLMGRLWRSVYSLTPIGEADPPVPVAAAAAKLPEETEAAVSRDLLLCLEELPHLLQEVQQQQQQMLLLLPSLLPDLLSLFLSSCSGPSAVGASLLLLPQQEAAAAAAHVVEILALLQQLQKQQTQPADVVSLVGKCIDALRQAVASPGLLHVVFNSNGSSCGSDSLCCRAAAALQREQLRGWQIPEASREPLHQLFRSLDSSALRYLQRQLAAASFSAGFTEPLAQPPVSPAGWAAAATLVAAADRGDGSPAADGRLSLEKGLWFLREALLLQAVKVSKRCSDCPTLPSSSCNKCSGSETPVRDLGRRAAFCWSAAVALLADCLAPAERAEAVQAVINAAVAAETGAAAREGLLLLLLCGLTADSIEGRSSSSSHIHPGSLRWHTSRAAARAAGHRHTSPLRQQLQQAVSYIFDDGPRQEALLPPLLQLLLQTARDEWGEATVEVAAIGPLRVTALISAAGTDAGGHRFRRAFCVLRGLLRCFVFPTGGAAAADAPKAIAASPSPFSDSLCLAAAADCVGFAVTAPANLREPRSDEEAALDAEMTHALAQQAVDFGSAAETAASAQPSVNLRLCGALLRVGAALTAAWRRTQQQEQEEQLPGQQRRAFCAAARALLSQPLAQNKETLLCTDALCAFGVAAFSGGDLAISHEEMELLQQLICSHLAAVTPLLLLPSGGGGLPLAFALQLTALLLHAQQQQEQQKQQQQQQQIKGLLGTLVHTALCVDNHLEKQQQLSIWDCRRHLITSLSAAVREVQLGDAPPLIARLAAPLLGLRCPCMQQPLMQALTSFPWGVCFLSSSYALQPAVATSDADADANTPPQFCRLQGLQQSRAVAISEAAAAAAANALADSDSPQQQQTTDEAEACEFVQRFTKAVERDAGDAEEAEDAAEAEEQRHQLQLQLKDDQLQQRQQQTSCPSSLESSGSDNASEAGLAAQEAREDDEEATVIRGRQVVHKLLEQLFGSSFAALLLETHFVAARLLTLHAHPESISSNSTEEAALLRDVGLCLRGWLLALSATGQKAAAVIHAADADGSSEPAQVALLQALLGVRPAVAAAAAAAALQEDQPRGFTAFRSAQGSFMARCDDVVASAAAAACSCEGCVLVSSLRALSLGEALVQLLFHILTYYEHAAAEAVAAAQQEQLRQQRSSGRHGATYYLSPWLCETPETVAADRQVPRQYASPSGAGTGDDDAYSGGSSRLLEQFPLLQSGWGDFNEPFVWLLAARVYALLLLAAPHCVRRVWSRCADSGARQQLESFTERFITPWFMKEEARRCSLLVGSGCIRLVNFEPRLRRVVATCKEEAAEFSIKVAVQFSRGFPLQRAKLILPGETVPGVPRGRLGWWALSASALMGRTSAARGLALWAANLSLFFEGSEECPICFSVIHPQQRTMPRKRCSTCRYKFHAECIYKWFRTSRKANCPLCQSPF